MNIVIVHREGSDFGGDLRAMLGYAVALRLAGHEVEMRPATKIGSGTGVDAFHLWAACSPDWGLPAAQKIVERKKPLIVTPFWWSRAERQKFYGREGQDLVPGYTEAVGAILKLATVMFTVTMSEAVECWKLAPRTPAHVVPMGVTVPEGYKATRTPDDFVLCIGRIEPHKNQLNLAQACSTLGLRLILIGYGANTDYTRIVKGYPNVQWLGNIGDSEKWIRLMRARVHALPSFFENPGLAHAEAAAMGIPAVMGGHGCEPEFFGSRGIYCDPTNVEDIAAAITEAWGRGRGKWATVPTWDQAVKPAIEWMEAHL